MAKRSSLFRKMNGFDYVIYILLALVAVVMLYPFIYVIVGSFNEGTDYMSGGVWLWPRTATFANYLVVFQDARLYIGFKNTIFRTLIGTAAALLFTSLVSYAMSRPELKFRKVFYGINMVAMFFSGGLIPFFLLIVKLNLYDTFWVYILPMLYSSYHMIVFSNFFRSISDELRESAKIDGASELRIFLKIYMPLSKAIYATIGLWIAVAHWNSYMATMLYTKDESLITLQFYLLRLIKEAKIESVNDPDIMEKVNSQTISFAAIVVATIPVLLVYPFLQKHFAKGVMVGAVKT